MKALIVEAEAGSRKLLAKIIQRYCKSITLVGKVGSIDEAYKFIVKKQPDLVFFDADLPSGTVSNLMDRLPMANFDIIFTAAYETPSSLDYQCNPAGCLMKPINIRELVQTVDNLQRCA